MKLIVYLLFISLLVSCSQRTTEIIIYEDKTKYKRTYAEFIEGHKKGLLKINKDDTLQIWAKIDGAPDMFVDYNGELKGFYIELEKAIMKEMDQKYNINVYDNLGPLVQKIKVGEAHSAISAPYYMDYIKIAQYSKLFRVNNYVFFYNTELSSSSFFNKDDIVSSLYGKRIGVQTRGHMYQFLRDNKNINLVEYASTVKALEALNRGLVDTVATVKYHGDYYINKNSWHIKSTNNNILSLKVGTGFSPVLDPQIIIRYNAALTKVIESGIASKLSIKYYGYSIF